MRIAIIAITANGAAIGAKLDIGFPGGSLFVIEKHANGAAEPFSCGLKDLVGRVWSEYDGFIFIMATGIVVRTIAPHIQAKDRDPAVVAVDDAGRFAVSLLSGHIGGANELADRCASLIGSTPVITTATDVNNLPSFDMLAKAKGWGIEDLSRVKVLNALLLEGKEIAVVDCGDVVRAFCAGKGRLSFYPDFRTAEASGAVGRVYVTNRILPPEHVSERTLMLRPLDLCLGIGCNRGTSSEEIASVVTANLARLSLSFKSVKCIATAKAKGDEVGLLAFAREAGIPVVLYDSEQLNGVEVPSPDSVHAFAAIGAKGVAEPAALLASEGGTLILKKVKDGNVTLAIAEIAHPSPGLQPPSPEGRG